MFQFVMYRCEVIDVVLIVQRAMVNMIEVSVPTVYLSNKFNYIHLYWCAYYYMRM